MTRIYTDTHQADCEATPQDVLETAATIDSIAPGELAQLGVTGENIAAFLPFEITTTAYRRRVLRSRAAQHVDSWRW